MLAVHIGAGAAGLALGPVIMALAKRRGAHTTLGETYHWLFLAVVVTSLALAAMNWDDVWFLAPVGVFSYAWALLGYLSAKRRRPGWLVPHVIGQGGSYISLLTPFLIVNWESLTGTPGIESPIAWGLPTLIGTPLIAYVVAQVDAGRRPKSLRPDVGSACAAGECRGAQGKDAAGVA